MDKTITDLRRAIEIVTAVWVRSGLSVSFRPALAEQVPHRICEFTNTFENGNLLRVEFVCTGGADAVISAIGKMAKAVIRLGQT